MSAVSILLNMHTGLQAIDDVMHAQCLTSGNIEVVVHIVDASYFVHADAPMETAAQRYDSIPCR